tara:strand:+ start:33996 stop:34577 length:582 start_codon:yes stop_codon:yes gene_type:complete
MLNPAEMYLSREVKGKAKAVKSKVKNFKVSVSKTIDKKVSIFRKKTAKESSLDSEIEGAIMDAKDQKQENIAELLAKEEPQAPNAPADYSSQTTTVGKSSFAKLYTAFVSYAKATYDAISSTGKKVDGFVKLTLQKILKVSEYVMCLCSPHWNKVEGSPEDMDSRAYAVSQKESVSSENAKYVIGQEFLRYRA